MLKFLKIFSRAFAFIVLCAVIVIIVFGVKDDPQVKTIFQRAQVSKRIPVEYDTAGSQKDMVPPLVIQARAFALRIDPPVKTVFLRENTVTKIPPKEDRTRTTMPKDPPDHHKERLAFDLLATVRYPTASEKSLALFQAGGRQEWFYEGQTVGPHTVQEIKDGCVTLSQPSHTLREVSVPPKKKCESLLKGG